MAMVPGVAIWLNPEAARARPKVLPLSAARLLSPESGPPGGVHQSPELRAPIRNTADGAVLAEPLFLAEFCNTPMAGAI